MKFLHQNYNTRIKHRTARFVMLLCVFCLHCVQAEASPCAPTHSADPTESDSTLSYNSEANDFVFAIDNGYVQSIQSVSDCLTESCPCTIDNGSIITIAHSKGDVSYCHIGYIVPNIVTGAAVVKGQQLGAVGYEGGFSLYLGNGYLTAEIANAGQCECVPNCVNSNCGDDGCGHSCGKCQNNAICIDGMCTCLPRFQDYECGDNGCGGTPKSCDSGKSCQSTTSADGNRQFVCESIQTNSVQCIPQCKDKSDPASTGWECGDDGCNGTCGTCPSGMICQEHTCICESSCLGRQCGFNACGEPCGTCPEKTTCDEKTGMCICLDENFESHPLSCRAGACGEKDPICGIECPCNQNNAEEYIPLSCNANNGIPTCGMYDEQGGRCGNCPSGLSCHIKQGCVETQENCIPDCTDKRCGDDGCGGTCGICGPGYHCESGACLFGGNVQNIDMISNSCQYHGFSDTRYHALWIMFGLLFLLIVMRRGTSY